MPNFWRTLEQVGCGVKRRTDLVKERAGAIMNIYPVCRSPMASATLRRREPMTRGTAVAIHHGSMARPRVCHALSTDAKGVRALNRLPLRPARPLPSQFARHRVAPPTLFEI